MPCYSRRLAALRLQIATNAAALAVPTGAGDGAAIPATWRQTDPTGLRRPFELLSVEIIGNPAGTRMIASPTLWGYDGAIWWLLAQLNRGNDIVIPSGGGGWAGDIVAYAAGWDRLAISGTLSGGNVDAFLTPIDPVSIVGAQAV